ncbi:MAG: response regulator [Deltaproteobacteria bacterium]|nr:response regulator [Deltaproteobacteria bacterium]
MRSMFARVAVALLVAGVAALALGVASTVHIVRDDKEAALIDAAVRRAEGARDLLDHRLALAQTELAVIATAAAADRIVDVQSLLSSETLAIRCSRGDEELLQASATGAAAVALERASAGPGRVALAGKDAAVVRVRIGGVDAAALVDLASLMAHPPGWSVHGVFGREASLAGDATVATRTRSEDGSERVGVVAPSATGISLVVTAPLGPARSAAFAVLRRVLVWSSLVILPIVALAWFLSRALTTPVMSLARAVRQAETGDEPLRLPPLPGDEIGDLGHAIDLMSCRLRDNAHALREAVAFARRVNRLKDGDSILRMLERALTQALPAGRWKVLSAPAVRAGAVPAAHGVSSEDLKRLVNAEVREDSWGRERSDLANVLPQRTTRVLVPLAVLPTREEDTDPTLSLPPPTRLEVVGEHLAIVLSDLDTPYGVVLGWRAALDEQAIRHAELLGRTALAALRNSDLVRAAVTNEKLLAVGRLAAGVAHEMNNPLAFILANLRTLEEELRGDHREAVADARQGAERLERIVRDLSSLSRGGSTLVIEEVNLAELARATVKIAAGKLGGVSALVDATDEVVVRGDRGRLEQVLLNLIGNAVDATRGRATPKVRIHVRRGDGLALVEVEDNGRGIPADVLERLFAPFFTTKGSEGTGLGLYLSRSFAHAHGGELAVAATGPEGTTLRLAIPEESALGEPRLRTEQAPTEGTRSTAGGNGRRRILVIDDEPALVRAMKRWLAKWGDVQGTSDAREGLELAATEPFSLVLCDQNMPDMTGTELFEALCERDPSAARRVVIMTGADESSTPADVRVIQKPLRPAVIEELLDA